MRRDINTARISSACARRSPRGLVLQPGQDFLPGGGLTKGDLVEYYLDVAGCVLNHVSNRPMQMLRYPDGVEGFRFYQKRVPVPHPDWLDTVHISFPRGGTADFPSRTRPPIAWIVNLGCIDLHTWHSRVDDVDRPDYLLIDLDPSEGNPWSHVQEIAAVVKEVMDELGLASFPKTSGATGLHILAPIKPELHFRHVRDFAKELPRRSSGGSTTRPWRRRPGRSRTGSASSSTTGRTRATAPSRVRFDPADRRRARFRAAALGRGGDVRPGRVHDGDDARADRPRGRPDERDVAEEGFARQPVREAGPRGSFSMTATYTCVSSWIMRVSFHPVPSSSSSSSGRDRKR